jgi:hypothetical protein
VVIEALEDQMTDGREIVTRQIVGLAPLGNFLAIISAIGIFGNFALNLGHTFKWW